MIRFISDLHLDKKRPETIRAFFLFLENCQQEKISSLYILGDFFEYWIGDDHIESWIEEIKVKLKQANQHFPIYFMAGNRDFSISNVFAKQTHIKIIKEPYLLKAYQNNYLLMHGDLLCTQDRAYLRFRKIIRNPIILFVLKKLPLSTRLKLAGNLRDTSSKSMQSKSYEIMDATQEGVRYYSEKYQCDFLIHGHTHRAKLHSTEQYKKLQTQRITLGDWGKKAIGMELNESTGKFQLIDYLKI